MFLSGISILSNLRRETIFLFEILTMKNWYKIAQDIQEPSKPIDPTMNSLSGKSNDQARKTLRNIVDPFTHKIYSDSYWEGPNNVFKAMSQANVNWTLEDTQYGVSPSRQQTHPEQDWRIENDYKEWKFTVKFTNNKARETILYCRLTAHGAGEVSNPLSKYDITVSIG